MCCCAICKSLVTSVSMYQSPSLTLDWFQHRTDHFGPLFHGGVWPGDEASLGHAQARPNYY